MTDSVDDISIKEQRLCAACVGEPYLRAEIEEVGEAGVCDYCGQEGPTTSIDIMADHIERAFEQHFQLTATEPSSYQYAMMKEGDYDWEREGESVTYAISGAAEIEENPAEDIRQVLEERHWDIERAQMGEEGPFDDEAHYTFAEPSDIEYRENWRFFENSLKTEARFFNAEAEATLNSVFEGLTDHKVHDGKPVIVEAGPDTNITSLYRARVFQSDTEIEEALKRPDRHVGPPPPTVALAGRMNAHGVSVFYGATEPDVAIGEVRPPVGSRVIVGKFASLRKIRLLDVRALQSVYVEGSLFDPNYIRQLERAKFLERLSTQITRPVMPDDEPLDYLVTQTIADYLAGRSDAELDGILYPSVQGTAGGMNVVLFHKSAKVKLMELPQGTEVDVHSSHRTDDGWELDYWVWETVPPEQAEAPPKEPDDPMHFATILAQSMTDPLEEDFREPVLDLDLESLAVHHIAAATFKTNAYPVRRNRFEKREVPF